MNAPRPIFLHGSGGSRSTWTGQERRFEGSLSLSLPGHPDGEGMDSTAAYADWVAGEVERIPPPRVLVGHSLGGLLAVHALNRRPDLFDAAIALSPSLHWGERLAQRGTEALVAARPTLDKALYVTVGNEGPDMMGSNRDYAEMLRSRAPRGLRWRFEEMAQEDHGSIVHRGVYRGFELVFEGWAAPAGADTLAELERHYQALSTRFRMPVGVPENHLNLFGSRLMAGGKLDDAIAVFRRNVELHPDSANVYDSLAEALEHKGDMAEAIRNYELAVRHAARNRDPGLELFMGRLAAARNRASKKK